MIAIGSIPVYKDPHVPLTRALDDGRVEEVLCWMVHGNVLVHPDRWDAFVRTVGGERES